MKQNRILIGKTVISIISLFLLGCATQITKPAHDLMPTKVKLGEYNHVEMKAVGISDSYASAEANQRALNKIDEILFRDMAFVFSDLKRIEPGADFSKTGERTLQITPYIKEIKFIGGGARFMVGAMAGSSAVLMQVTLRDSSNGEIIADNEFYRSAGAYSGGWSVGVTDNKMLEDIAEDVVKYCSMNK